jgi:hypothetical protein
MLIEPASCSKILLKDTFLSDLLCVTASAYFGVPPAADKIRRLSIGKPAGAG